MNRKLEVLQLEGDHYQIGYQHGKALAIEIEQSIKLRYEHLKHNLNIDFEEAIQEALKYLPNAEKYFPEYIEEIEGISEGAQIPFENIFFIQVASELAFRPLVHCSAFAVTAKYVREGKVLIGQNMDSMPSYRNYFVFHIKTKGKPEILMLAIPGVIGYLSLNQLGLAHVFNTLTHRGPGWKYGVAHYFVQRKIHEMKSVKECAEFIKELPIASSANYLISDGEGQIMDLEVSTEGVREIYSDKMLVHTNHFLHEDFIHYKESLKGLESSKFRLNRMTNLIEDKLPITIDEMISILSDHENFPEGLCRHPDNGLDIETVISIIYSPQEGKMLVAPGTPCNTSFQCFNLKQ